MGDEWGFSFLPLLPTLRIDHSIGLIFGYDVQPISHHYRLAKS